jgi:hypothetical protein
MKTAPLLAALVLFVHLLAGSSPFPMPQEPAPITGASIQKAISNITKTTQKNSLTSITMEGNVHPHNLGRQGGNVKRSILFATVALFVLPVLARSAPITGAQIQTWTYDQPTNTMTVRVVNTSAQPITAFVLMQKGDSVFLIEDFLRSRTFHEAMRSLGATEEQNRQMDPTPDALVSNATYDEKVVLGTGDDPKDFAPAIVAVAFEDNTTEASDPRAVSWIVNGRKAEVADIEKANAVLAAAPDHDTAIKGLSDAGLNVMAYNLEQLKKSTKVYVSLKDFAAIKEKERQIWLKGVDLKTGGAQ